jgi:hypothetical protein
VQFRQIDILPFGLLSVLPVAQLPPGKKQTHGAYVDLGLSQKNAEIKTGFRLAFTARENAYFKLIDDTIAGSVKNLPEDLILGIRYQDQGNFSKAIYAYPT